MEDILRDKMCSRTKFKNLICIIMSTYNGERYLEQQIDSIAKQDIIKDNIKLIIRDDGSSDKTLDILKKWEDKIDITCLTDTEKNIGPSKSFWRTLKMADGYKFYAFADQDDIWDIDKISCAIKMIERNNNDVPVLYVCNNRKIDKNGNMINRKMRDKNPCYSASSLLISSYAQGCAMVFNAKAREEYIRFAENTFPMHDLGVLICTVINGKVIYDINPHFSHRIHNSNADAIDKNEIIFKRIKKSFCKWKKRAYETPLDRCAAKILEQYGKKMGEQDRHFYELVANYKKNIIIKVKCINAVKKMNKQYNSTGARRGFVLRTILGLL